MMEDPITQLLDILKSDNTLNNAKKEANIFNHILRSDMHQVTNLFMLIFSTF